MNVCELDRVGLCYRRRFGRTRTLKERALQWLRGARAVEEFWVLRDVSFQLGPGETLGVIGANGSGKSSLLRLLAGIYPPDRGTVRVRGRVAALLELGAGFQPDLTGRENVFLYGAILGFSKADILQKLPKIHDFSGLGELIDTPVRHFSSGMIARLGFAVAAHLDPDLMLVDEILAVGDFNFQQRCIDTMMAYRDSGRSLLLVSHDLEALGKLCRQALWLDGGQVRQQGPSGQVLDAYRQEMQRRRGDGGKSPAPEPFGRWGTGELEITRLRVLTEARTNEPLQLELSYFARQAVDEPVFGIGIHHSSGLVLSGPNTRLLGLKFGRVEEGAGAVRFSLEELPLLPGDYGLSASAYDWNLVHAYDHRDRAWRLCVEAQAGLDEYGCIQAPWKASKLSSPPP